MSATGGENFPRPLGVRPSRAHRWAREGLVDRCSPEGGLGGKLIKCVALLQQQDEEHLEGEEVDAAVLGLDHFGYSERLQRRRAGSVPVGNAEAIDDVPENTC